MAHLPIDLVCCLSFGSGMEEAPPRSCACSPGFHRQCRLSFPSPPCSCCVLAWGSGPGNFHSIRSICAGCHGPGMVQPSVPSYMSVNVEFHPPPSVHPLRSMRLYPIYLRGDRCPQGYPGKQVLSRKNCPHHKTSAELIARPSLPFPFLPTGPCPAVPVRFELKMRVGGEGVPPPARAESPFLNLDLY